MGPRLASVPAVSFVRRSFRPKQTLCWGPLLFTPLRSGPKPCPKRNLRAHWIRLSVERTRLSVGERRSRRRATRRGTAGTASRARSSLASGDSFARARPTQRVPSCRCVIFRQPQPLQRPRRSASAPRLPRSSTRGRGRSRLRSGPRSCADSHAELILRHLSDLEASAELAEAWADAFEARWG